MLADGLQYLGGSVSSNLVLPAMTESGRLALVNVDVGEVVYQTTGDKGLYIFDGTNWQYGIATVQGTGHVTTLDAYGIIDAVQANAVIPSGTGAKISYDSKGLVTGSSVLDLSDIPDLPASKLTGKLNIAQLPEFGTPVSSYVKVYVDSAGRVIGGEENPSLATLGIDDALAANPDIIPGTGTKITYDSKGLIVSSANLLETDIPNINANKITGTLSIDQLPNFGVAVDSYTKVTIDASGRVIGGSIPSTLDAYGITDAVQANTLIEPGSGTKIVYDSKGLIVSAELLLPSDIPDLDASKITTGQFSANFAPIVSTLTPGSYTKVTVDATGRVILGETPSTLADYNITDAVQANPLIASGFSAKVQYDSKGLIVGTAPLVQSDIPELNAAKITTGKLPKAVLPNSGITDGWYYKVRADIAGRIVAGSSTLVLSDITGLQAALDDKTSYQYITSVIDNLAGGVDTSGNTLKKLYDLILASSHEVTVANSSERANTYVVSLPTNIFVLDDGDGRWALYKALDEGFATNDNVVKISDPDLLNAALGYTPESITNKDTDGALAANSDLLYPSQRAVKTYADTKIPKKPLITPGAGAKVRYDQYGLVTGTESLTASDIPEIDASKITSGILPKSVLPLSGVDPDLQYVKVTVDSRGFVIGGATTLTAQDIVSVNASTVTTGKLPASVLPNLGTGISTFTKVTIDSTGRVVSGSTPSKLADYGITDAVAVREPIEPGVGYKITYDAQGLILSAGSISASDLPTFSASKIGYGTINSGRLPLSGVDDGTYVKVGVDTYGRVVTGVTTIDISDVLNLSSTLDTKADITYVQSAINTLKGNTPADVNTLKDVYDLISLGNHEVDVPNTAARDALVIDALPMHVFVVDDGDSSWALYKVLYTDAQFVDYQASHPVSTIADKFLKISDQTFITPGPKQAPELLLNKSTNVTLLDDEGNTSDILYPSQNAVKSYVDAAVGGGVSGVTLNTIAGTLDTSKLSAFTTGDLRTDPVSKDVLLSDTGVTPGTYNNVTVDSTGRVTSGINTNVRDYKLHTTSKIEIIDNKIELPYKPEGDLCFNMMMVYDLEGTVIDYDSVTIEENNGGFFAVLNESETITGYGVVSYLIYTV